MRIYEEILARELPHNRNSTSRTEDRRAKYIVTQVNSSYLIARSSRRRVRSCRFFGSFVSRGASAIGISWMVTGLVTVNGNIRSEVVNLKDLTFSPVDEFLCTLPF